MHAFDRQTDGRTDRRTDRIPIAIPQLYSMQRGKNVSRSDSVVNQHTVVSALLRCLVACTRKCLWFTWKANHCTHKVLAWLWHSRAKEYVNYLQRSAMWVYFNNTRFEPDRSESAVFFSRRLIQPFQFSTTNNRKTSTETNMSISQSGNTNNYNFIFKVSLKGALCCQSRRRLDFFCVLFGNNRFHVRHVSVNWPCVRRSDPAMTKNNTIPCQ